MPFNKGGQQAREEAKKAFPTFARTNWFSLKDNESITVRFIDDSTGWIWITQHGFVPTKGAPPDWKPEGKDGGPARKWNDTMNAVCRKAKNSITKEWIFPQYDGECFICDYMTGNPKTKNGRYYPSIKVWARVIVRDEIIGTQEMADTIDPATSKPLIPRHKVGQTVGCRDKIVEVQPTDDKGEKDGDPIKQPEVQVVNQGLQNFFNLFQAYFDAYGTVCDRDYRITRRGDGLDTTYDIVALDPIIGDDGEVYSLQDIPENAELREEYLKIVDLEAVITSQADDRHYDTWFDTRPGHEHPVSKKKAAEADEVEDPDLNEQPQAQSTAPDAAILAAMRERMMATTKTPAESGASPQG